MLLHSLSVFHGFLSFEEKKTESGYNDFSRTSNIRQNIPDFLFMAITGNSYSRWKFLITLVILAPKQKLDCT